MASAREIRQSFALNDEANNMVSFCKLDHSDPEVIPEFLCAACHPEQHHTRGSAEVLRAEANLELSSQFSEQHDKRRKRKLRAEVREWRDRIALMQKYNKDTTKAEEALRKAEHALYLVA